MWVAGHLATSYLLGHTTSRLSHTPLSLNVLACLAGGLLPDLIDKPLLLLQYTPYGRSVGHSMLSTLLVCVVAAATVLVASRRGHTHTSNTILALATGWFAHLGIDFVDDTVGSFLFTGQLFTAWMGWPYLTPDDWDIKGPLLGIRCHGCITPLEWCSLAAALSIFTIRTYRRIIVHWAMKKTS